MQVHHCTPGNVAAAVAEGRHAHPYQGGKDFDAYVAEGGYMLLKACLAGERTRDNIIKAISDAGQPCMRCSSARYTDWP